MDSENSFKYVGPITGNPGLTPTQEKRSSEIEEQMNRLHDLCERLVKVRSVLQTRLSPVLIQTPELPKEANKRTSPTSPLGGHIFTANEKIEHNLDLLNQLIRSLSI